MLCKGQLSWEGSDCSEMCSDLELGRCKVGEKYSVPSRAAVCIRVLRQENTLDTGSRQVMRQPTDVVEGGVAGRRKCLGGSEGCASFAKELVLLIVLVPVTNHKS